MDPPASSIKVKDVGVDDASPALIRLILCASDDAGAVKLESIGTAEDVGMEGVKSITITIPKADELRGSWPVRTTATVYSAPSPSRSSEASVEIWVYSDKWSNESVDVMIQTDRAHDRRKEVVKLLYNSLRYELVFSGE